MQYGLLRQNWCLRHWQAKSTRLHAYRTPISAFKPLSHGPGLQRSITLDAFSAVLLPPAVFGGLLITLWAYKCAMMVVFQNKIIYMPSVPPFSRSEKVEDYKTQCRSVEWTEHSIKSVDGTSIKLLEGTAPRKTSKAASRQVVVLYFQGQVLLGLLWIDLSNKPSSNASSLPPRLPYLSQILTIAARESDIHDDTQYTLVALSYRGFWTSRGKPTQPGIELDAEAAISWVLEKYNADNTTILLWGQSIGAGVVTVSLANRAKSTDGTTKLSRISGLLLETPFINLRAMLIALYPQKFLPYRYLAPFLLSTWDSEKALRVTGGLKPNLRVLILQAGGDELVPADNAPYLQRLCEEQGLRCDTVIISGALHTEIMAKPQGRSAIAAFIQSFRRS